MYKEKKGGKWRGFSERGRKLQGDRGSPQFLLCVHKSKKADQGKRGGLSAILIERGLQDRGGVKQKKPAAIKRLSGSEGRVIVGEKKRQGEKKSSALPTEKNMGRTQEKKRGDHSATEKEGEAVRGRSARGIIGQRSDRPNVRGGSVLSRANAIRHVAVLKKNREET